MPGGGALSYEGRTSSGEFVARTRLPVNYITSVLKWCDANHVFYPTIEGGGTSHVDEGQSGEVFSNKRHSVNPHVKGMVAARVLNTTRS